MDTYDFGDLVCMFCGELLQINTDVQIILPHHIKPTTIRCPMSLITLREYAQILSRIKDRRPDEQDD
jgi:hypothetical protein